MEMMYSFNASRFIFEIYTITDNIIDNELYVIADLCGIFRHREKINRGEISKSNPVSGFLHSISKFTKFY